MHAKRMVKSAQLFDLLLLFLHPRLNWNDQICTVEDADPFLGTVSSPMKESVRWPCDLDLR